MSASLEGRVVLVGVDERAAAVALATKGATVVVIGSDAQAVGTVVREVAKTGARATAFVGDPSIDGDAAALAEMLAELY